MPASPHQEIRVADVMTRGVFTLTDTQSLPLAETMMDRLHVRHIPVVDAASRVVGMLTHRDILRAKISSLAPLTDDERSSIQLSVAVSRIMRHPVWTIPRTALAVEAARLMREKEIGCLPVVEDDGTLIGIVTESDLLELVTDAITLERPARPWTMDRVMTPLPITIGLDTTVVEARQLMQRFRVRHLPVVDKGESVMMVEDRVLALAEAIFPQPAETRAAHATRLLGSAPIHRVQRDTRVSEVLAMMARERVDAVIVMDFERLIGIFTASDSCRWLAERLH